MRERRCTVIQAVVVVTMISAACGSQRTAVGQNHDSKDALPMDDTVGLEEFDGSIGDAVFSRENSAETTDVEEDSDLNIACGKEGEVFASENPECCDGLVAVPNSEPDEKGNCGMAMFPSSVCVMCYDGICGTGENTCNCPEDCG